jgi:sorbose reductase
MCHSLEGKVALITGAARGIGREIARGYAEAGARLALADLDLAGVEGVAQELGRRGTEALPLEVDVSDPVRVERMVERTVDRLGGLDVAVNNAGICVLQGLTETTDEQWRRVMSVNLDGVFYCSRAEARMMITRGGGGSIINMASMSGLIANHPQQQSAYNASKAAVIHFTRSIAAELAPHGIRANAVSPGYVDTDEEGAYAHLHPTIERDTPLGRLGRPEEMRGVFLFLATTASSYMTGSNLVIDGGFTIW